MSKHLFVIRHAKSDWGFDVSDFDRPLNPRGFHTAPLMATRLAGYAVQPQLLVSSPAKRAITTAQVFAKQLGIPINAIQTDKRIYDAWNDELLDVINDLDNQYDSVALFGHNPGIGMLVNYLGSDEIYNFPTCAIAHLRFDGTADWTMVRAGEGVNAWFTTPGVKD